jgi:hypothetical protein
MGQVRRTAIENVQLLHPCRQELMAFSHTPCQFVQLRFRPVRKMVLLKRLAQAIQSLAQIGVLAFEPLKRLGERSQPSRLDKGFSSQAQQPIQTVRRQTHDALLFLFAQCD